MSVPSSDDDEAFDQAIHWILRLDEFPADPETQHGFRLWLAASPERRAEAMAEARAFLTLLERPAADVGDELGIDAQTLPARTPAPILSTLPAAASSARARPRPRRWRHAAAASVVLALATGAWLGSPGPDRLRSDAYTRVGQVRQLPLEDGSVVTLNTDTALTVRMEGDKRTVGLLRGEAFFQVARDPRRPFVVESADGSARVLGTAFNVHLGDDGTRISVIEGRVSVSPSAGGASAVLTAGRSARLAGDAIHRQPDRDPLEVTAWQRRQLVFYNAPLSEVARELSRYRRGVILVRGEATRSMPVSGSFSVADPDAGLRMMLDSLRLEATDLGWLTVIHPPSRATDTAATPRN